MDQGMSDRYFGTARTEILPYVPEGTLKVLELGCGKGATLEAIRARQPVAQAFGVEIDPASAAEAEKIFDRVWTANIEDTLVEQDIEAGSLDLILCLDVLEHLADPWSVVKRISPLLAPKGRLIISLPNIRNWKFIRNLLFKGDFNYRDAGLLDRTHLRFFVRHTAVELGTSGGLDLVCIKDAKTYSPLDFRKLLLALSFGKLEGLIAKQYVVVCQRN
jgi:2-polyprenyl-3-methyl-5-hydroxy-6-metoxy-1,4-benzoquinol methylase